MSNKALSIPEEESSGKQLFYKETAFWVGFGILGLLLLLLVDRLVLPQVQTQLNTEQQTGWTTLDNTRVKGLAVSKQNKVLALKDTTIGSFSENGSTETLALDPGLLDAAYSIAVDSQDRIWVVSRTGDSVGMHDTNGKWTIFTPEHSPSTVYRPEIVIDGQDRAWIEISGASAVIDPVNQNGPTFTFDFDDEYGGSAATIDDQGRVWRVVGGGAGDLLALNSNGTWEVHATNVPARGVEALVIDHQGLAWVAASTGVDHLQPDGSWIHYDLPSVIGSLAIDRQGRIWAGDSSVARWGDVLDSANTAHIYIFDLSKRWIALSNDSPGLARGSVHAIAVDNEDKVWIATDSGLSKIDSGLASSTKNLEAIQRAERAINSTRANMPSIALGIVLIAVLGIVFTRPNATENLPDYSKGFVGWYIFHSIYIGVLYSISMGMNGGGSIVFSAFFLLLILINVIAFFILLSRPKWRKLAIGMVIALITGIMLLILRVI